MAVVYAVKINRNDWADWTMNVSCIVAVTVGSAEVSEDVVLAFGCAQHWPVVNFWALGGIRCRTWPVTVGCELSPGQMVFFDNFHSSPRNVVVDALR